MSQRSKTKLNQRFITVEIYFRGVNATSTGETLLRRRDNRSTNKCVEDQLSEQRTTILLPGEQNQSDHSASQRTRRISKRDM